MTIVHKLNPIVFQVILSNPEGIELLETANVYDNSPMHTAAEEGHLESVKLLIQAGCKIDRKNEDEQTPLHLATINGRLDIGKVFNKYSR